MDFISASMFYGNGACVERQATENKKPEPLFWVKESRKMPSHILGPRDFWMEFDKQADALKTAAKESTESDIFCTFVYQRDHGYRRFVVAHPEMYWWHYEHRPAEQRCSYEVIPENYPCRLYLDLEYPIELNTTSDGPSMTYTVVEIFSMYLLARWGLPCNKYNVIDLDSSTDEKFSRHLIFNLKFVAFRDNYHVGRLVKTVCKDIMEHVSNRSNSNDVLSCFDRTKLEQLIVHTRKGRKLFVDTAVYTKNRHFRIYKSTKWGKCANLVLSDDCKYLPTNVCKDKELNVFLDSLVSYFPTNKELILLEYMDDGKTIAKRFDHDLRRVNYHDQSDTCSKYPVLDMYISSLISPGKIRTCKYFESTKTLVYETLGYRYCENIGRCHKSNNVFLIVDLKNKTVYQKCHDEDCAGFKSSPKPLPEEIYFHLDEEGDMLLECAIATEDMLKEIGPL